ncbi:MAG: pilus assembly PilX N-terminal domain-containing protein [Endomicrobia bacterium]|nr:pilus assembly PilX N-terminal domain-containing protein [Endomicrobiia bacterium]
MNNKRGSILAISIIFVFVFMLLGMFAMRLVILQNETSDSELYYTRAHFAALYGSEMALYNIMNWENIATSTTYGGGWSPDMRKFLARDPKCFNFAGGFWYPLRVQASTETQTFENHFSDEITGGAGSGIVLECTVEEDLSPNVNDGFIPNMAPSSMDQRYGTYKFYVIKTVATIYKNVSSKTDMISEAQDHMYFMIAYSSGSAGASSSGNVVEAGGTVVRGFHYSVEGRELLKSLGYNTVSMGVPSDEQIKRNPYNDPSLLPPNGPYTKLDNAFIEILDKATAHFTSAPSPSLLSGKVQPIFRYYIRGRR